MSACLRALALVLLAILAAARGARAAQAQLDPDNPEFRYGLGTGSLRLSQQCLRELQAVAPQSARVHHAQGHGLRVQGPSGAISG